MNGRFAIIRTNGSQVSGVLGLIQFFRVWSMAEK